MEVSRIIAEIDAQISKLEQAKALLQGSSTAAAGRGRPRKTASVTVAKSAPKTTAKKKRNLSAEARERIAEAQKRRWAQKRKEAK